MTPCTLNRIWKQACRRGHRRFIAAARNLEEAQTQYLRQLLDDNRTTRFGKDHAFASIRNLEAFQQQVPVRDDDALTSYLHAVQSGDTHVLTCESVLRLEPTSGTGGAAKLIPVTARLRREFNAGLQPWIWDLFEHQPAATNGPAYWAISPAFDVEPPPHCRLPVGFQEDGDYLGVLGKVIARSIQAVPTEVRHVRDPDAFLFQTVLHLLAKPDLALISVWSPTFLLNLLNRARLEWREALARALRDGSGERILPSLGRAASFERSCESPTCNWGALWPRLDVISCWADAWAVEPAQRLMQLFPRTTLQPKGLLATEAFITLPMRDGAGWAHLLSPLSHFYEFLDVETGEVCGAHQLIRDRIYEVIVTTGGGLYRYALKDRVMLIGWRDTLPMLRFLGRSPEVSDLVGEKLHTDHVERAAANALKQSSVEATDWLLRAHPDPQSPFYEFCICLADGGSAGDRLDLLRQQVESEFEKNPHYAYARSLGQLAPLTIRALSQDAFAALRPANREATQKPQRLFLLRGVDAG